MITTDSIPHTSVQPECFTRFKVPVHDISLPGRFTFPFHYTPHPLCLQAARELRQYLDGHTAWGHNFGIEPDQAGEVYGKMFGVLVVMNQQKELGYLAAFSGKIGGKTHHPGFVPPVFDLLDEGGFYRREEDVLSEMNRQIENLEKQPFLLKLLDEYQKETAKAERQLEAEKQRAKNSKLQRKLRREEQEKLLSAEDFSILDAELIEASKRDHYVLRDLKKYWKQRLEELQAQLEPLVGEIQVLKETRKKKSSALQQHIFDHYFFLNQAGQQKSLADIFQSNAVAPPPSGAGECAAPKLLQYAFLHHLKPVAMAEFWWGESPVGEVRKHGQFYPACRGKCEPILGHMLEGMALDKNPMLEGQTDTLDVEIVYEDKHLLVVNKPASLLSVPGKNVTDSVLFRMKQRYPDATGPLVVHRLDMGTSGLMLVAKTAEVYKALQSQFIGRTIKKRYVAVLEGVLEGTSGTIDLPLRVDLDDRPRQMVCYTYGKHARTEWTVIARGQGTTRVHFFPITGRTHQLRVHAAHTLGLHAPILGDELYGNKGERLLLHADRIEFKHPVTGEVVVVQKDPEF
ncbi:MAG: RNA pseudouridine synthase [Saprospiraceae bacterium]|nr:RNA pseudouridine synthase [Saprospiraceae bacterium]